MHEQEVLALLRAGDERGAEALLRHYAPLMRSTARGKSPAAARSFRATCPPPSRRPRSGSCSRSADRRSSAR